MKRMLMSSSVLKYRTALTKLSKRYAIKEARYIHENEVWDENDEKSNAWITWELERGVELKRK
jgi:hypothetical protein